MLNGLYIASIVRLCELSTMGRDISHECLAKGPHFPTTLSYEIQGLAIACELEYQQPSIKTVSAMEEDMPSVQL